MKLRWVIVLGVAIAVITLGISLVVLVIAGTDDARIFIPLMIGTMALLVTPIVANTSLAGATFDLDEPPGSDAVRRTVKVAGMIQLLGVVAFVVVALAAPQLIVILAAIVAVSAVLLFGGVRLARRMGRTARLPAKKFSGWAPWSRTVIRRKVRRIIVVFIAVAVSVAAIEAVLDAAVGDEEIPPVIWLLSGLSFACIATTIACVAAYWPLMDVMRDALGNDYSEQKRIGRVVLRGTDEPLAAESRRRAAAFAIIRAQYMPFQIAQFCLIFAAVALQQGQSLATAPPDGFSRVSLGVVIVILVSAVPVIAGLVRQQRRARAYAAAHPDDVAAPIS